MSPQDLYTLHFKSILLITVKATVHHGLYLFLFHDVHQTVFDTLYSIRAF